MSQLKMFKALLSTSAGVLLLGAATVAPVYAQEAAAGAEVEMNKAANLDELLQMVEERRLFQSRQNQQREREFTQAKGNQQKMLTDARAEKVREEARSDRLETTFEGNETKIGDLQETYDKRLGSLKELFGELQRVAGDTRGLFSASIVSAQHPGRGQWLGEFAAKMGSSSQLATIEEMERLWYELQREMTATGEITSFPGTVVRADGSQNQTTVTRVGAFNLVADGEYIKYDGDIPALVALSRQPSSRFVDTIGALTSTSPDQLVGFGVDPTRGSLISLLIQGKTPRERIDDGGAVGSVIIGLGIVGLLLALERLITLGLMSAKVRSQAKSDTPSDSNPLGRILKVYHGNKDVDVETLELKLGEAILSEMPKITARINMVQVIAVVAPLLGLLGTVIGMILTFQAITLFGTGDPKTMAGGISTALMTTVLGLVVAIPMTLLHAVVASQSKGLLHVLEEQSAGIIADHAEKSGQPLG